MNHDTLVELQNEANRLAAQDPANDAGTILESLIEEAEQGLHNDVWAKLVCCMDEGCFSDDEWEWLKENVKPEDY